jgi:hypothetical protein
VGVAAVDARAGEVEQDDDNHGVVVKNDDET